MSANTTERPVDRAGTIDETRSEGSTSEGVTVSSRAVEGTGVWPVDCTGVAFIPSRPTGSDQPLMP